MTRRYLLLSGLILLIFALIGVVALPLGTPRNATESLDTTLPDSLTPAPDPAPVRFDHSIDPVTAFATGLPWFTMLLLFFIVAGVIAGTLLAANGAARPDRAAPQLDAPSPRGMTPMWGYGLFIAICVIGGVLIVVLSMVRPEPDWRSPDHTPSAGEMTNDFMQTAIAHTATVNFQTQSAPTIQPAPTPTPTPRAVTSGPPEPLHIFVYWPSQMAVSDVQYVNVNVTFPGRWPHAEPGNFADPFGADYESALTVTLSGSGFQIAAVRPLVIPRMPDSYQNDWSWQIRPEPGTSGRRVLSLTVEGTWTPLDPQQRETIHRVLARPDIVVNVTNPPAPTDTLRLLTLASGLLGSILSIPWLYAAFRHGQDTTPTRPV